MSEEALDGLNIVFKPNPGPQSEFLASTEREVLYGGGAGSGKSYAILADPMYSLQHPHFSGLLLRHTTEELRELIWKSQELYPKIYPGIKWSERKMQWEMPNGGRLWMSYLDRDEDVLRYQGQAFCVAKDTPVLMNDGSHKPVQAIQIGDTVATLEGGSTVSYKSPPLRKSLVKVKVYDCFGQFLTEQIQPDTHPIALLSSEPSTQLDDLCHTLAPFLKSQIQWHSYKQLQSSYQENRDFAVLKADGQTGYEESAPSNQESSTLQGLFYPLVLHSQSRRQAQDRASIQYCASYRSDKLLSVTGQSTSESLLDQQRLFESSPRFRDRNERLCRLSSDDVEDDLLGTQKAEDLKCRCLTYNCQCDEQLLFDLEAYQCDVRTLNGVVQQDLVCLHCGGTDCIRARSRYQLSEYTHPYTKEQRRLEVPVELGFVEFEPFESPDVEVFDLTIEQHNHYITFGGVINKNCWIGFDELTQWRTNFAWDYMRSRLRTAGQNLPLYMRATTNPGSAGHAWVKKMFIDPSPFNKSFWATDISTGQMLTYPKGHSKEGQPLFKRKFVPALLKDNPYLYEAGDYEANLLSLPEHQRKQLLEGSWDVAEGAAFPEFNRAIHVVEPYNVPNTWTKFRACDYGYGSWTAVLWFAVAPDDTIVVYRELYVTKVLAEDLADMILNIEQGESIQYGMLDSSCWHKRGDTGPSIAERMIVRGCRWRPSDRSAGSRVAGKNEVHRRLQIDTFTNAPRMVFFNNCKQLIADLPTIPLDKKNPEDVDTSVSNDHVYDALRYGLMSRPRAKSIFDYDPTKPERHRPACDIIGY